MAKSTGQHDPGLAPAGPTATSPVERAGAAARRALVGAPAMAVEDGVADRYWLELVEYPPDSGRSLWLKVAETWRRLDNTSDGIQASVQAAFGNPDGLEVAVWYQNDVVVGFGSEV